MNQIEQKEFYVGYLPQAPPRLARRVRHLCLVLFILAIAVAILLVSGQRKFPLSVFEFQHYRQFEGSLRAQPYPTLFVERPDDSGKLPTVSAYLLVAPGKHGAAADVAGYDNQRVRLQGALIYRDGRTMIEVVPHSLARLNADTSK